MAPNKRSIIPLWGIFNLISNNFKKRLSLWLFLRLGLWLIPGWDTSVSLSLVDIWVNRLVRLVQSYIYISVDLCDPVNPLFDTFGAPVCSQRFGCGIIYSLVQSFAFCQCNLVLVPRTHNALLSIKLLCWENIRAISKIVAALMAVMHHNFTIIITMTENDIKLTSISPPCNGPPESVGKRIHYKEQLRITVSCDKTHKISYLKND